MNIFWGMKILWGFFGGSSQNWIYLGVISMHFSFFLKVLNGGYCFGLVKFQIIF